MEPLSDIQEDIQSKISKARSNFKKSPKDRLTVSHVETRLENLEQQWSLFLDTHTKIVSKIRKADLLLSSYHKNGVYDEVEESYIEFKSELKEKLLELKMSKESYADSGSSDSTSTRVRLPEIKIPTFSGKYTEWQSFRDLFLGLVHNNKSLDKAQKFYYLKGHLTGEAEQLLRNIQVTAENYTTSWEKLEGMYNNKKFIANGILKRLLNQKGLTTESANEIKRIVSTTTDCLNSIKNLGVDVSSWDILIIHIISAKLDKDTRKAWELKASSDPTDELPSFVQFTDFLTSRFRGLENLETRVNDRDKVQRTTASLHVRENRGLVCVYCSAGHKLNVCNKFLKEPNNVRRNIVREKGICFVCLGSNHLAKTCKNTIKCQICHRRHHTVLHPNGDSGSGGGSSCVTADIGAEASSTEIKELTKEGAVKKNITAQDIQSTQPLVSCLSTGNCDETVLLTTAIVKAESKDGTYRLVRTLLDQGSQGSFITESMVQYLGLKKNSSKHSVTGVGGNKSIVSKYTVMLKLKSRIDPNFEVQVQAYVLTSITSLLPATKVTRVEWINLNKESLADPEYHRPNKIDILLGAEIYSRAIQAGLKKGLGGAVVAQDTAFGWILSGVMKTDESSDVSAHIVVMHVAIESDNILKKFWELEAEPSGKEKILSEEEIKCEKFFSNTTQRRDDGRYVVRLPFCDADPDCKRGESRAIALKRFKNLEVKLGRNIKLKEDYVKVMQEYYDLGHMVRVAKHEVNRHDAVYLPHHAVIREDKDTTKVRVVFDASCKGKNGVSLNDCLMVGPTLQAELRHIIIRWRRHPVAIAADIVKMYRQVLVDRKDTRFQRILWRDSPENAMEEYELVTVTFGTASAPYLAVRTLQQVAEDEGSDNPTAVKIIKNDFYMDGLMTGATDVEKGYGIYNEISRMLNKAGFQLQKWVSNDEELLNKIKAGNKGKDEELRIKVDNIIKILGLTWNPRVDSFHYSVDLPPLMNPATKRNIISDISRLFDPMGWLAPSIVLAKILIQKLWLAGIDWDQEVPSNILHQWLTYRNALASLVDVKIPRWIHTAPSNLKVELHGFSDASKMAYAAVIYVRVVNSTGEILVSLVSSKTKVAPIKQVSIPRLELCGAVLLAKLLVEVAKVMEVPTADLHAWTDSEVVLAWLNSHPSRWKTFVANRVAEILLTLDTHHWSHISSKENPADCASRGVSPSELVKTTIWFQGPEFLRQPIVEYKKPTTVTKLEEVKVHATTVDNSFWNRYSTLSRLVRVVAYCRRFLNFRNKLTRKHTTTYLSAQEIDLALNVCIKKCQEEAFESELQELKTKGSLGTRGNKFKSLNLFLDSIGLVRVGGRLEMSQLDYSRKHPILLPKDSAFTRLLILDAHRKTMHGGPQAMITYLRARYWILGVKNLVKACVRKCVPCIRYSTQASTQLMGQLPPSRLTPNCKAFLRSGVDYAGPINIRVSKGRGNKSYKGYIALFICMSTRAIHLEAVSDLTSSGFMAAFKRFVARRGRCAELYSDNGTNFVGAARELLSLFNEEKSNFEPELAEYLANNGTQWSFIPPRAANFGGLWEAGIKSTKFHLKRVIGNSTLTFEEMATVLAQIEACLNSRPLSYVDDPNETLILTPGHFLVGEPLVLVPDSNYENSNIQGLRRWQLTQRMLQDFWRRWSQDYLHQFLQRHKWSHRNPEPSVGDIVLVKENDMPPGRWLLGKIEQKHPGPDDITRVVTIFTKGSLIKRPISKICVLPVCT